MRDEIPGLLAKNMFLSETLKTKMLLEYVNFDETKIFRVYRLLTAAMGRQMNLLKNALRNNPQILGEMKREITRELREQWTQRESVSRTAEEQELDSLDDQLNALFN